MNNQMNKMTNKIGIGGWGEEEAAGMLRKKGYKILERNFKTRKGEIDIIAMDGDTVVFVEVKLRQSNAFGLPKDAVDSRKKKHLVGASREYLLMRSTQQSLSSEQSARFDVIGIELKEGKLYAEHIQNAFEADE